MNREQAFLLVLVAATGLLSLLVLLPFLEFVFAALLLGYVLRPVHRRVTPYLGRRAGAVAVILGSLVAVLLPLSYVGLVLYRDAQAIAAGESALAADEVQAQLTALTGEEVDLAAATGDFAQLLLDALFGSVSELLGFLTTMALGVTLVLFLVYYVLLDGPAFVQWAVRVAPMDDAVAHRLAWKADQMTWGVVVGHIFVAVVQGLIGGLGLWAAGVPNPVFWTFVMVVMALLPIIGAFVVWGPAAAYLYLVGDVGMAVLLALWGLAVVSMVDNYLRSIVIDQSARVNPGVILVGVIGGVFTFGFVGLFVGPIAIGLFAATIRAFDEHYDALDHATPPPDPPSEGRLSWLEITPRATSAGGSDVEESAPGDATTPASDGDSAEE